MTREQLLRALEALPGTATLSLPVADLLEALGDDLGAQDLDVAALAKRFGRSPSTVRSWCESGLLPGAYRLRGRSWRIPPAAVAAFREAEARGERPGGPGRRQTADLGAWRGVGTTSAGAAGRP